MRLLGRVGVDITEAGRQGFTCGMGDCRFSPQEVVAVGSVCECECASACTRTNVAVGMWFVRSRALCAHV